MAILGDIPPLLPSGSLLDRWVFEQPIPLAAILMVGGLVAWYALRSTGRAKDSTRALVILVIAAVGVYLVGTMVTTERERLIARTKDVVHAVAAADTRKTSEYLAEDAHSSAPLRLDRAGMLSTIERQLGAEYKVKEHSISDVRVKIDGPNAARTQTRVWASLASGGMAGGSWWMIGWRKDSKTGQWQVVDVELQHIDGVPKGMLHP